MAKGSQSQRKFNSPQSKSESQEFGGGRKGLVICNDCRAVYYKKHWHQSLEKLNLSESANLSKNSKTPVSFALCPACKMIRNHQYEGEVVINNAPAKLAAELENFIKGFCKRASERDPMDRLIAIKKSGSVWRVTVTENELANKLGKKIQNLYSNAKAKTSFDRQPSDVARVTVEFLK